MALDQVKTQVLILHSEQSALDDLSAGIDDRYTVHCASSGTEALNTLGETPIHVIISAQDLPGMSGVEALREARKRSPETIGILLAGTDDKDLEALVGEEEVFQIVRGGINGDDLATLIDNATRQMRLLALAESANDTAANPDEPAEHIVMETSENGSTIISDGTGQVPILDPQKISPAQAVGSNAVDILVLTKDEEFLATVKESSRGMHNVRYANTLAQAEAALAKHNVGVAVVDAAMVGSKVEKLTQHLSGRTKRLVNIVAGRRDDGEMLMDLINRGKVYRFLLKPVSPGRARLAVEASVKHHLEAPDSAFKVRGAPAPAAKPPPKPAQKSQAIDRPAAKPKPQAKKKASMVPKPTATATPNPASLETPKKAAKKITPTPVAPTKAGDANDVDPIHVSAADGLSAPFGDDDSSFTATMTGIVEKVGKTFSGKDDAAPATGLDLPEVELGPSLSSDDSDSDSTFINPKILGIGGVAIVAIAAAGFWLFGGSEETSAPIEEPAVAADERSVDAAVETQQPDPVPESRSARGLLDEARLARDAGQIFNPPGSNAIELYAAAAAARPDDETIVTELQQVVDQAIAMTETAMLDRRLSDASAALDRVRFADPDNARLPFLTTQLEQIQIRDYLDAARVAIRESRFEDASDALAATNALNVSDTTEIDAVIEELNVARSAQRVEDVLAQAAARMTEGSLVSPPNDNARYYYQLALTSDPGNTAARQGLTVIAGKLILQARTEIDRGRFSLAENLIEEARLLDPESGEVAATDKALNDARDAVAVNQRRQQEARQAAAREEAERLAALQRAEEDRRAAAAAAVAAAASAASADEAPEPIAEESQLSAQAEAPADQDTAAVDVAPPPVADEFIARASTNQVVAEPTRTLTEAPIGISALTRTKYVAPKYPRAAERRNQSGWVEVVFTVTVDGTTRDIEIRDSQPGDVFITAATRAVERWEFEPIMENGQLVEKRVGVRMMFALE